MQVTRKRYSMLPSHVHLGNNTRVVDTKKNVVAVIECTPWESQLRTLHQGTFFLLPSCVHVENNSCV